MHLLRVSATGLSLALFSIASPLQNSELVTAEEQATTHIVNTSLDARDLSERVITGAQSCTAIDQDQSVHYTISIGISDGLWRCNAAYNAVSTECDTDGKNDQCISNWSCKSTSDGQGFHHIKFLAVGQGQGQAIDDQLLTVFPEIGGFNCPNYKKRDILESRAAFAESAMARKGDQETTSIISNQNVAAKTAITSSSKVTATTSPANAGSDHTVRQMAVPQITTCSPVTLYGARDFVMSSRCQTQEVTLPTMMAHNSGESHLTRESGAF